MDVMPRSSEAQGQCVDIYALKVLTERLEFVVICCCKK